MHKSEAFKMLGLRNGATDVQIRSAFRDFAFRQNGHPDRGGDLDKFQRVSEAYTLLIGGEPTEDLWGLSEEFVVRGAEKLVKTVRFESGNKIISLNIKRVQFDRVLPEAVRLKAGKKKKEE